MILIPLGAFLAVYCYLEYRAQIDPRFFQRATLCKVFLSLSIAVLAWWFCVSNKGDAFSVLLALGLSFAVPADYFLQFIDSDGKRYSMGIFCFSLMHLSLLAAFFYQYRLHLTEFILFVFVLFCVFDVQRFQKWKIQNQRVLLSVYTVLVTFMASKAMASGFLVQAPQAFLVALGGVCFLASDIILGIWEYHAKKPVLAAANRAVYFIGQLFFACSLFL